MFTEEQQATIKQMIYAGVRQAVEDARDLPRGLSVEQHIANLQRKVPTGTPAAPAAPAKPNAKPVATAIKEVIKEEEAPVEEAKPKKKRASKKKAEPKQEEEAPVETETAPFTEEDETPAEKEVKAEATGGIEQPEDAKAFVMAVKKHAGGNVIRAKKILKSLIGVTSFADCPEERWTEYLEALADA